MMDDMVEHQLIDIGDLPPYGYYEAVKSQQKSIEEATQAWKRHLDDGSWDPIWLMFLNAHIQYEAQTTSPGPWLRDWSAIQVAAARHFGNPDFLAHILGTAGGVAVIVGKDMLAGVSYQVEAMELAVLADDQLRGGIAGSAAENIYQQFPAAFRQSPSATLPMSRRILRVCCAILPRLRASEVASRVVSLATSVLDVVASLMPEAERDNFLETLSMSLE